MVDERSESDVSVDTLGSSHQSSRFNPFSRTRSDATPLINSSRRRFLSNFGIGNFETSENPTNADSSQPASDNVRSLDTFSGVFTPVCLSMFSVLLFLRVGYCVGHAGLLESLLMFIIAYIIVLSTVFSVCAVSTNGAVEGGGAYFMISRTLGPEFGGSIGALFFLANIFSSALYITGCVEGILNDFGPGGMYSSFLPANEYWKYLYYVVLNTFNLVICLVGTSMFARLNIVIFVVVVCSALSVILSFLVKNSYAEVILPAKNHYVDFDTAPYTGFTTKTFYGNLYPHYGHDYDTETVTDFARVFGVIFSGVTGIMAGANMSGELKDPSKSIPLGTILAVVFTFFTYILVLFLFSGTTSHVLLQNNYLVLQYINLFSPLLAVGIFAASLSASLSNLIGASRVLQAVAKDKIFGPILKPIVKGTRGGNPYGAVILSWVLVQLVLLIGSYNKIAQITSVFFLISYAAVNLACLGLRVAAAPNFRPKFKYFSWHTASIGLIGCFSMMFMISPIYAAISIIVCLVLIITLHLIPMPADWGSISQALIFHQVRKYLLMLDSRKDHIRFWRPQMLLMVSNPRSCLPLISFINDIKKGGLYLIGHVKTGSMEEYSVDPTIEESPMWQNLVNKMKIKAFVELTLAKSVEEGLHQLLRLSGIGAMKPNTAILGFYDSTVPIDFFTKDEFTELSETFQASTNSPNTSRFYLKEEESIESAGFMGHTFADPVSNRPQRSLNGDEYIEMVKFAFKMKKNVCLARHFHLLNKKAFKKKTSCTVDVWPVNFFEPINMDTFDNTWMFIIQLACILYMVPFWHKRSTLRVFMCTHPQATDISDRMRVWQQWLDMLRVDATIRIVNWDYDKNSETEPQDEVFTDTLGGATRPSSLNNLSSECMQSINNMIKEQSTNTAINFLYLPSPPKDRNKTSLYLQYLTEMTNNLPPTLFVHGSSPVTSTTL